MRKKLTVSLNYCKLAVSFSVAVGDTVVRSHCLRRPKKTIIHSSHYGNKFSLQNNLPLGGTGGADGLVSMYPFRGSVSTEAIA